MMARQARSDEEAVRPFASVDPVTVCQLRSYLLLPKNSQRPQIPDSLKPRYKYQESTSEVYTGKDVLGRECTRPYDDRRIHSETGKFVPLEVQSTTAVLNGYGGSTWKRRRIKGIGPWTLILANWPFQNFEQGDDRPRDRPSWLYLDYFWKSVVLLPAMIFLVGARPHNRDYLYGSLTALQRELSFVWPVWTEQTMDDIPLCLTVISVERRKVEI